MKSRPLVSVIIPTYNREKLLPDTINSVLNQSYKNWELIIIDDRSTDNTKQLIQKYIKKDKRIKYCINTHKQGISGARNEGIKRATGEFIAFLDSDDRWLKHNLKDFIWFFSNSDMDLVFSDHQEKDLDTNKILMNHSYWINKLLEIPNYEIKSNFLIYKRNILRELLEGNFITTPSAALLRKKSMKIKFDEDLTNGEDVNFWLRCVKDDSNVGFINKINCIAGVHEDNASFRSKNPCKLKILINQIIERKKRFKIAPQYKNIIKKNLSDLYFSKGLLFRKTNKPKALFNYLTAMYYHYDTKQLKAIKKLFTPGYYKR